MIKLPLLLGFLLIVWLSYNVGTKAGYVLGVQSIKQVDTQLLTSVWKTIGNHFVLTIIGVIAYFVLLVMLP